MSQDNWVRSLGLDADGSLFVDIDKGIRLYDLCLKTPLPAAVTIHPEHLMKPENRQLYYSFLTTLKEIESIIYHSAYDAGYRFKRGDIVVDAGARIGTFAAKVSSSIGDEGKIVAIEPEPRNFTCLQKNIAANCLNNVIAVQKMLWSRKQHLDLYLSGNPAAHSACRDEYYGSTGECIVVDADTLDNILEGSGLGAPDFIKMDIEGSEIEALKGMKKVLEFEVQLAIAAYHPVEGKPTHTAIIPQLERLGFKTAYADGIVQARR